MDYLLLLACVGIFTIQTLCFKEFNRSYMKNLASYFLFDFLYFSLIVAVCLAMSGIPGSLHPYTIALGISFGVTFVGMVLCYMKAMELGPLSYTSLFNSFGIIVPILFGLIFWGEDIGIIQGLGLFLLLVTFYLGNEPKKESKEKVNAKWLMFCLLTFIGNGGLMTFQKAHQVLLPGQEMNEFVLLSFGIAGLLSLFLFFIQYVGRKQKIDHFKEKTLPLTAIILGAGLTTAFGNQLVLYLASRIPSVIQFPTVNGGIVILSTVICSFLYHEKVSRRGATGLVLGLAALVMLSAK